MPKPNRKKENDRLVEFRNQLQGLLAELRGMVDEATARRERELRQTRQTLEGIMAKVSRLLAAAGPLLTPEDVELLEDYQKELNDAGAVVLRGLKGRGPSKGSGYGPNRPKPKP